MLDIGWMELVVIGVVALIVVGPKELPGMFRTAGQYMGKARSMAREFQRSMEQAADESGLKESARELNSLNRLNLNSPTKSARKYAQDLVRETREAVEAEPGHKRPPAPAEAREQAAEEPAPEAEKPAPVAQAPKDAVGRARP